MVTKKPAAVPTSYAIAKKPAASSTTAWLAAQETATDRLMHKKPPAISIPQSQLHKKPADRVAMEMYQVAMEMRSFAVCGSGYVELRVHCRNA